MVWWCPSKASCTRFSTYIYESFHLIVGYTRGYGLADQVNIKGHATNAGFLVWAGKLIAETDAHIIEIFRAAGASESRAFLSTHIVDGG